MNIFNEYNTDPNIKIIIDGFRILDECFRVLSYQLKVGMIDYEIDRIVKKILDKYNCNSAPIKQYDFPGVTCISINDCLCHGYAVGSIIKHNDVVKVDISFEYMGQYFDNGRSFFMTNKSGVLGKKNAQLMEMYGYTRQAVHHAILLLNQRIACGDVINYNDIGITLFNIFNSNNKYLVSINYGGHVIGKKLHEHPYVCNYIDPNNLEVHKDSNVVIKNGDRFCIEPLVKLKNGDDDKFETVIDGWFINTKDKSHAIHYEATFMMYNNYIIHV